MTPKKFRLHCCGMVLCIGVVSALTFWGYRHGAQHWIIVMDAFLIALNFAQFVRFLLVYRQYRRVLRSQA